MKRQLPALFLSVVLLIHFSSTLYANENDLSDKLNSMTPIIRTYANNEPLYQGESYRSVSCSEPDEAGFWNMIHAFSIFNYSQNPTFTYTRDNIANIAYAMFSDFDGTLSDFPSSYYQNGGATIEGDTITFMPAQPEVQDLDLVYYSQGDDNCVNAVYLQRWDESYYSGYPEDNYFLIVNMRPNQNIDITQPFYYTIESIDLDRELTERNQSQGKDTGPLQAFLGRYILNTTLQDAEAAGSNPEVMELYVDRFGHLIRYRGLLYGTLGTTRYNIMNSYVDGDTLKCEYNAELGYANTFHTLESGTLLFTSGDGKLLEGNDVWYRTDSVQQSGTESSEAKAQTGFIIPGSDSRYLTIDDLKNLTSDQLRLARNEIYARHGRRFKDSGLQAYFDSQSWYSGTVSPDDFQESTLNDYERKNADMILDYEKG